jgi:hypothetical protein
MTQPTGRSFLSYRRTRAEEARLLIEAQHEVGIPTWLDTRNLGEGETEGLIRERLADNSTSNALCLFSPEVAASSVIQRVELPCAFARDKRNDDFFLSVALAGGLDYPDADRIAGPHIGLNRPTLRNLHKCEGDPLTVRDAADIARKILVERIRRIHKSLPAGEPIRIHFQMFTAPPFDPSRALSVDWTHCFERGRTAGAPPPWEERLLPALRTLKDTIYREAPERAVLADGKWALPAAVALGRAFEKTTGIDLRWQQDDFGSGLPPWSLRAAPEESGFRSETIWGDTGGGDWALLVSVTTPVEPAVGQCKDTLPKFRGYVAVQRDGDFPHAIQSAGQAAHLVDTVVRALQKGRIDLGMVGRPLHLFLSVPAGIAVMIGQSLTTFGRIHTYDYVHATGGYRPAVILDSDD